MLRILHAADFHLDSPFAGLTPEQAQRRRGEQRELLEDLAALARAQQVQLVLLPGDLLDGDRFYPETAQALTRALGSIPCPVFLAPGNHDFFSPQSVYAALTWPDNVHVFSSGELERFDLPELNCAVWGRAFTAPREDGSPLAGFSAPRDGVLHIGCLHGDTMGGTDYAPIAPEEMAGSCLHYLALGHIHQYSGLQKAGGTHWAYPGCPQGRGFDETGKKGVLLVDVDEGSVSARFVPLARRRYEILSVDLTGAESALSAIEAALPPDTQDHIYRILLTGEGETPDLSALERALSGRFYGLTLRDHTRLPRDLWRRKEEDTLTGLFLRELWPLCEQEPDNEVYQLAVRFGLAALEGGEDAAL